MDVYEAIAGRRSTRAFKPDTVPAAEVKKILRAAVNAPSANNLQPWEFVVVAGEEKQRLSRTLLKAYREKQISCGSGAVKPLPETFRRRGAETLEQMKGHVEKTGQDIDSFVNEGSCDFYGAPVAVLMCLDDCFSERQKVDTGAALAYFVLAAHASGLGTCPVGLIAAYEDEIRELLDLPENKKVVIGIALGYPDPDSPAAGFRSARDDIESFVKWVY